MTHYLLNSLSIDLNGLNLDINDSLKLYNRLYQQFYRVRKRIELLLSLGTCYFITLTISDDKMNIDHRRYIKKLFKGFDFIINVDYSPTNNRKHYHGVVYCPGVMPESNLGFYKYEKINSSSQFLSKYILKFTRHAIKEGTQAERILYSRGGRLAMINYLNKFEKSKLK